MSTVGRNAGVALGCTTLALTGLIEPLVGRGKHLALYHWDGQTASLFGPVLVIFALVWAALAGLLFVAERRKRMRTAVWGGGMVLFPWLLANAVEHLVTPVPWLRTGLFFVGAAALIWMLRGGWAEGFGWLDRMAPRFVTAMLAIAFSGTIFLLQIGWFWWSARELNAAQPLHVSSAASAPNRSPRARLIWIVFDELSYRQVYEKRFAGLHLPAFDALADQAMVFTHVVPAGSKTDIVLPSLISGEPITAIRASAQGELLTQRTDGSPWQAFRAQKSVFQDALDAGYSTGVAGWYNPYCRILPAVLDHCFWSMYTELDNGLSSDGTLGSNLGRLLVAMAKGRGPATASGNSELTSGGRDTFAAGHLEDYRVLSREADRLLDDPSANFLLLHMPVPHPDGIFDRRSGQYAIEGTTYLDNLVLADRCLAEMRARLERTGAWDAATVVVMGDHSWRVNTMWRQNPQRWTEEEERATEGGHFDDRPAYVVKLPGEHAGGVIPYAFRAVETRQLLDRLMGGEIKNPAQLAQWVKHRESFPQPQER